MKIRLSTLTFFVAISSAIAILSGCDPVHGPAYAFAEEEEQRPLTPEQLKIERVVCRGNEITDCDLLKRELNLHPGDQVNETEISNAKIRLGLSGLFKESQINLKKGSSRGLVELEIEVTEGSPWFTEIDLSTTKTRKGLSQTTGIAFGNRNVFGTGKTLLGEAFYDTFPNPSLGFRRLFGRGEYRDPHLFGSRSFYFTTGAEYFRFPDFYFDQTDYHLQVQPYLNLGYRFGSSSYLALQYQRLFGSILVDHSLTLTYGWNSTDDPYFPTQGSIFNARAYYAFSKPFSKNYDYLSLDLSYRKYIAIAQRSTLALNIGSPRGWRSQEPNARTLNRQTDSPYLGIGLNYDLMRGQSENATFRNLRLYVDGGFNELYYSSVYGRIARLAGRTGAIMDVPSLGIVNLSFIVQDDRL